MSTLSTYHIQFLEHLEIEKNRSERTVRNYDFYVSRYLEWFGADKKPADITHESIRQYRLWLNRLVDVHGDSLKKNTQNYHLIALRTFLKYLAKRDIKTLPAEKIELMKMPDRDVSFLGSSDLNRILEAPVAIISHQAKRAGNKTTGVSPTILIAHRDKAILELLFSTGLRVSELSRLKRDDLNLTHKEFTVTGKGKKKRVVFLSEQARHWIKAYLSLRTDIHPFLFISHDKRTQKNILVKNKSKDGTDDPLTPRSIQRIVHKYAKIAGITKSVTPHTLRHTYATDLLQNGADIRSVQSMLGHSSITTTQIYTHITDKELRSVHTKFHGKKRTDD